MSLNNGLRWQAVRVIKDIQDLANKIDNMKAESMHVSCINCNSFDEKIECCMRYRQRPPARVIAYGCQDWANIDDDVPF
jgi:hypothetical protein